MYMLVYNTDIARSKRKLTNIHMYKIFTGTPLHHLNIGFELKGKKITFWFPISCYSYTPLLHMLCYARYLIFTDWWLFGVANINIYYIPRSYIGLEITGGHAKCMSSDQEAFLEHDPFVVQAVIYYFLRLAP